MGVHGHLNRPRIPKLGLKGRGLGQADRRAGQHATQGHRCKHRPGGEEATPSEGDKRTLGWRPLNPDPPSCPGAPAPRGWAAAGLPPSRAAGLHADGPPVRKGTPVARSRSTYCEYFAQRWHCSDWS